jgi:alkanesulfonate monooxygenase SsuD/methylene tetrahydromethanopterin reductase-like flavin-dependent oxidoreductase (luciferase family)
MMANPTMRRPLILIADAGHLGRTYSWRKGSCADADPFSIGAHVALARNAEAAGIDAVFQADFIGLNRASVRRDPKPPFESFQLAAVIAAMVPRITVIPTASVLFSESYTVARNLVSLDHIAAGRLAWNLVTSFHGERNFGYEAIPAPVDRYRRAGEFLNVVRELWHSWPQEANRPNVESGEFVDASQIQDIHHRGEFYSVAGAIDAAPLSRRLPLVLQAGASPDGIDSAIRGADAIFAAAPTLEHGERLVTKVRARAAELGRDPETLRFIFGMRGVIAGTAEAAQASVSQPLSETELAIARDGVEREIEGLRLDTLEPKPLIRRQRCVSGCIFPDAGTRKGTQWLLAMVESVEAASHWAGRWGPMSASRWPSAGPPGSTDAVSARNWASAGGLGIMPSACFLPAAGPCSPSQRSGCSVPQSPHNPEA